MATYLATELIQGEVFDLALYRKLLPVTKSKEGRKLLQTLIPMEEKHIQFWEGFFRQQRHPLHNGLKLKLWILTTLCQVLGTGTLHLVLEATEIYSIRKYLKVWERYKGTKLATAVRRILQEEFEHEEQIVDRLVVRRINPEKIRNIFLGLNDGLVEILGAVAGFFAAFGDALSVTIAGTTVAVAGSISMAAGVFISSGSEKEIEALESGKQRFLGMKEQAYFDKESPLSSGLIVGVSYFLGSLIPILPVLLGAKTLLIPALAASAVMLSVSWIIAYLSGMDVKKRILINIAILFAAVGITYAIGTIARQVFGIVV